MASAVALNLALALAVLTLGAGLMLFAVSAVSFARLRNVKLLLTGGGFAFLAVKGGLWVWRAVQDRDVPLVDVTLDFLVLLFLYLGVAKR